MPVSQLHETFVHSPLSQSFQNFYIEQGQKSIAIAGKSTLKLIKRPHFESHIF